MRDHRGGAHTELVTGPAVGGRGRHRRRWSRILVCSSALALVATMTGLTTTGAWAGPPTSVTGVTASLTSAAAGAQVNWTVGFTVSATGGLPGNNSSTVSVTLPTGSSVGSPSSDVVTDTTTGQSVSYGYCGNPSGTTVTCTFDDGNAVNAGDTLSVVLYGVTNPATTGPVTFSASTSADTQPASASVTLTAAQAVTGVTATETSTAAGAQVTVDGRFHRLVDRHPRGHRRQHHHRDSAHGYHFRLLQRRHHLRHHVRN
jgi:hypothetical protein